MFKYISVTILFLFVLTACQTDIENKKLDQTSSTNNVSAEAEEPMSESKEQKIVSLEDKLFPPKFSITHFEMTYLKDKNQLLFESIS